MSTNYELNEPVINAVIARINANLNTTIDTINADRSDAYPLEHPAQVLDYMPSPAHLVTFPTIGIRDGRTRFQDDNGYSATGVHSIVVAAFVAEPDLQTLSWVLRRYEQALVSVLMAGRNLDNGAWGVVFDGSEPGPTIGASNPDAVKQWMSWVAVGITAKRDEL